MKERTRKGTFRSTETIAYKMAKHHGFDQVSWMAFQEAALDKYDFTTCQRSDGSYYGSSGRCLKGTETTKQEKSSSKKKDSGGADAVAPAPPKTTKKDPVASVQKQQKETAALKKGMDKEVTDLAKSGKIKGVSKADVERIQQRKAEKTFSKEVKAGDADGMYVKGGERVKPDTLMKNVGKQIEKEYGLKMDANEANGQKIAAGFIDGFVTSMGGKSFSVSMESMGGGEWIVESISEL